MQLIPKKTKFKKYHKGKNFRKIEKSSDFFRLKIGSLFLVSLETKNIHSKQLLSLKSYINKFIKKRGKVVLGVFPSVPVSNKPIEVRMGKGKGSVSHWVSKVRLGKIICEVNTASLNIGLFALRGGQYRLPLKTKILFR